MTADQGWVWFGGEVEKAAAWVPPALYAPAASLACLLFLWLVKRILFRRLRMWARGTSGRWDDILVQALSFPANMLIVASGIAVLTGFLPLPDHVAKFTSSALQGTIIFAVAFFLDQLVKGVLDEYASKSVFSQISHGLTKGIVRGLIIGIATLIFLDLLGISITPILASLGIGSLAVALALQDTLSNFFAGIYVAIDRPVDVGDFVRLEGGQEGFVTDIGWRSTKLKTQTNNVVIVPNSKIIGSILTNYYLPDRCVMTLVEIGVAYGSDLERVEKVTLEVAAEVMKSVTGGVPGFVPAVKFHTFGESSVNFTVVMQATEFTEAGIVKHEFIKRIHERYRREGIEIPYPTRTLEVKNLPLKN